MPPRERDALRAELIALGKALEQELAELAPLKDEAKALVERWKALQAQRRARSSARTGRSSPITSARPRSSRRAGAASRSATTPARRSRCSKALAARAERPAGRVAARLGADAPGEVRRRADAIPEGADARAGQRARAHQRRLHLPQEAHLRRGDRAPLAAPSGWTTTARRRCTRTSISASCISSATCSRTRRPSSRRRIALGPNLIEAYYELGRAYWFNGQRDEATADVARRLRGEQVQSVGKALRRGAADGGAGRGAVADGRRAAPRRACSWRSRSCGVVSPARSAGRRASAPRRRPVHRRLLPARRARSRARCWRGAARDRQLSLAAAAHGSACSSPSRPTRRDSARGRGPTAPEWGAALAFPESRRIVMQGRSAGSDAGDPQEVLRHELAHLALHERLGDLPPRWFDEGYASVAAREWRRDDVLAANVALALRGAPTLDAAGASFGGGHRRARSRRMRSSYRAVAELASLDPRARADPVLPLLGERAARSTPPCGRRSASRSPDSSGTSSERTRRRYGALALFADLVARVPRACRCCSCRSSSRAAARDRRRLGACSRPTQRRSARNGRASIATLLVGGDSELRAACTDRRRRRRIVAASELDADSRATSVTIDVTLLDTLRAGRTLLASWHKRIRRRSHGLALVGDRGRDDPARLRRSGARGNHDRTDLARAGLLRPRAHRDSEVAVGHGRLQQMKGFLASAAGDGFARASVSPGE